MTDMNKILGKLLGSSAASGFAGGLAGGFASSLLTGKKGKKGKKAKKMAKNVLKAGGIAAVGALAYTAYQRYNSKATTQPQTALPPTPEELLPAPAGTAFMPDMDDNAATEALGLTLVRAMVAAARSDGRLDAEESQAIFQKIESLGLDSENQALLVEEMGHPVDMDAIVNSADCPEVAAEIYIASLLAVEVDTAAETGYMAMLAARLCLPAELVAELEHQVEVQKELVE